MKAKIVAVIQGHTLYAPEKQVVKKTRIILKIGTVHLKLGKNLMTKKICFIQKFPSFSSLMALGAWLMQHPSLKYSPKTKSTNQPQNLIHATTSNVLETKPKHI